MPRILRQLVAIATLAAAAACSSGATPPATPGSTPTTADVPSPAVTGALVTATLNEYSITLSQSTFPAGTYTFVATESGQRPHALSIKGAGLEQTTSVIQPGGASQQLTVTLKPGSYELWCPVGNHKAQGMDMTITVS